MGKPTGFLEYIRKDDPTRAPAQRVRDWEEFHIALPDAVREQQGSRCMNCGVPFCQTGMIYKGKTFLNLGRYSPKFSRISLPRGEPVASTCSRIRSFRRDTSYLCSTLSRETMSLFTRR